MPKKHTNNIKNEEQSKEPNKDRDFKSLFKRLKNRNLIIGTLVFVAIAIFATTYLITKHQLNLLKSNSVASTSEDNEMVKGIRKHFELPNEEPNIKTIGDTSQLNKDQFFTRAKKGDKVVIFKQAKRAMLFRPSTGKVIEYSVINL